MLATLWRELHDHSWYVAQVDAPFNQVVDTLTAMRAIRSGGTETSEHRFELSDEDTFCLFMVYSRSDSSWTYLESVNRYPFGKIPFQLSKKLKTVALDCGYEASMGMMNYECFRNGTIIESCATGSPEFFDPHSDCFDCRTSDGKKRDWKLNSKMTIRYFGKSPTELNIEEANFYDFWIDVSKKFELNIPYLDWDLVGDAPMMCEPIKSADMLTASILLASK